MTLISVVTPVMNRADTLERCLASVAAQTHPDIEHIVVDGGSTDGTLDVLRRWERTHPIRWISEPDEGMYDAINKGLAMASGEILSYLNSDDVWFPWTLAVAAAELERDADMAFGDLAIVTRGEDGHALFLQFYRDFDLRYYTHHKTLAQPTVAWRRQVTDDLGGFDDSYRLIGDCEYWLRAAAAGYRLVHVGEVQAVQVEHAGTLRNTHAQRLAEEFTRLREHYGRIAGPAGNVRLRQLERSLEWRVNQWQLRRELARPVPLRWHQFIQFMRDHDLQVDRRRLLLFQLPASLRPGGAGWLDPARFEAELDEAVGLGA